MSETEYVIGPSSKRLIDWRELWQFRELFHFFALRDLKVKYKQAALGILWVVLQPLVTVLIFSVFFGRALNAPSNGLQYPVFVFSGLLLWNLFSLSISAASNSMISNSTIIKKIYFPRIIIPISAILVTLIDFAIAFGAFLAVLVWYAVDVNLLQVLVYWPTALLLTMAATIGLSCWLAALNVKYRDFRYIVPFALQIGLFASPVIYPTSIAGKNWVEYLLAFNPMYAPIQLFRTPLSHQLLDPITIVISVTMAFLFLVVGIYYFKKTEAYFADIA